MRVRYIYSACVVIETSDARILCDPWFTPGAYDGAWFQYPLIVDPIAAIGPSDVIYISHIHPDHYDPAFLRRYLKAYPETRLLIGKTDPPYLANKMKMDGFRPEVIEQLSIGATDLLIVPNRKGDQEGNEIDTALAVRANGRSIVNMNDNPFVKEQVERLLAFCPNGRADFALLPYSGAGPYPQTFSFAHPSELVEAAARKKEQFIKLFEQYLGAFHPVHALPFAGKYWLGGKLAELNSMRGVPDAMEMKERFGDHVIVLADGGQAFYDLETRKASAVREQAYDLDSVNAYLKSCAIHGYDYEREIAPLSGHNIPILPLLTTAKRRARSKVQIKDDYWIIFRPQSGASSLLMNVADDGDPEIKSAHEKYDALMPRLEIVIDERYLFGLLTRLYHWNNAEVGSQYHSLRVPIDYQADVYRFLNMLQV